MNNLELRIPPPLIWLLCACGMWWQRGSMPLTLWQGSLLQVLLLALALMLLVVGAILGFGALLRFRQHKTTASPTQPQHTRHLVTSGVYRISRNPMYLGLICWLLAWGCYVGGAWLWVGPMVLAAWLTRFQIIPEERLLHARFGADYAHYCQQVRRWC
ncbi:MAG: methyltransferase family protein [Aeromonas sp.]